MQCDSENACLNGMWQRTNSIPSNLRLMEVLMRRKSYLMTSMFDVNLTRAIQIIRHTPRVNNVSHELFSTFKTPILILFEVKSHV